MLLLLLSLLVPQTAPLTVEAATREIQRLIADSGAEVAVAYRPLYGGGAGAIRIEAGKTFHAASTMKVPVMIELFRLADAGRLKLDDTITVGNTFRSIVDGSPYELSATEDSDGEVYKAIGKKMTLRQLIEASITVSSNLATNILIEKLGAENIQETIYDLGGDGMLVRRGVEDTKAFEKGLNNQTTAEALMVLLERIALSQAASPKASREMAAILKRQKFNDAIPAGVPKGIEVGHKTGSITRINHDAAIVYADKPYVLVVLVRGIEDGSKSGALIAAISRVVYSAAR
ncbi:MAG: class A beta-lactamase-related serine hydrolase [Acidobacteriota bacterium]|nr:class A beta-lactamase-related serine hydrolase [Acidobacteriota bacterium]